MPLYVSAGIAAPRVFATGSATSSLDTAYPGDIADSFIDKIMTNPRLQGEKPSRLFNCCNLSSISRRPFPDFLQSQHCH